MEVEHCHWEMKVIGTCATYDVTLWPFISEMALGREVHKPAGLTDDELKMNEAGQLS